MICSNNWHTAAPSSLLTSTSHHHGDLHVVHSPKRWADVTDEVLVVQAVSSAQWVSLQGTCNTFSSIVVSLIACTLVCLSLSDLPAKLSSHAQSVSKVTCCQPLRLCGCQYLFSYKSMIPICC